MTSAITVPPQPMALNFNISHASLLQFSRLYRELFLSDLEKFQELNPGLNRIYASDWLNAIITASDNDTTEIPFGIYGNNYSTHKLMASCRKSYKEIIYYAQTAFLLNEFGRKDYLAARTNTCAMVNFMDILCNNVIKYNTRFFKKGFSQKLITELFEIRELLASENLKIQAQLNNCSVNTKEIISQYNLVYKFCQRVNRASKVVFMDDISKLQQYMFPGSENEMKDTCLTGVITQKEDNFPLENASITIPTLSLTTKTDELGVFAFTRKIPEGKYTFQVSAKGRKAVSIAASVVVSEVIDNDLEMIKL